VKVNLSSQAKQGAGYKAQNNTLTVMPDPDTIESFRTELIAEHLVAQHQGVAA
jgi:hypothetical protein